MKGNPGVTIFSHDGREQIYAFVRGDNGRLHVCFWNAAPGITSWQWDDRGQPADARVNSSPTAITSIQNDAASEHFLHTFVRGNNGHVYEHFWDGTQWVGWVDHDQPHWTVTPALSPDAVTFRSAGYNPDDGWTSETRDSLMLFTWGSDDQLYRYVQRHRQWNFQGPLPAPVPPQSQPVIASEPAVIRSPQVNFSYLYAYVVGSDGQLYTNHSVDARGADWSWRALGKPDQANNTAATLFSKPSLVRFTHDSEDRIYAFVRGSDGHLWNHFWKGWRQSDQGTWGDLGTPSGTTLGFARGSGVLTFRHDGTDRIYVFVRGNDDHLHVCFWDGSQWNWADLGRPTTNGHDVTAKSNGGDTRVSSDPGVTTFRYIEPNQTTDRMYAFVRGDDNHLHQCYWNGLDLWLWNDLGTP